MKAHRTLASLCVLIVLSVCTQAWAQAVKSQPEKAADVQAKVDELEAELERLREQLLGDREVVEDVDVPAVEVEAGPTEPTAEAQVPAVEDAAASDETSEPAPEPVVLTKRQREVCQQTGIDPDQLAGLIAKPLYAFSEAEVDVYLKYLSVFEPELTDRVRHLARKNIGQPYELYLLGEMPFEHHDPQPIYCLTHSDCVVFSEHTYAMALSDSWPKFIRMLQRIRYQDGRIGVATRNHYTEADWNLSNRWLVRDITRELARQRGVRYAQTIDRAKFLKRRYKLDTQIPVQEFTDVYLPFEDIDQAKPRLRTGDFVNVIRGIPPKAGSGAEPDDSAGQMQAIFGGSAWAGHVGMIIVADDGEVHFIHSASPHVREEPIDAYIARSTENLAERDAAGKARLLGFKFLRLQNDPLSTLRKLEGHDAPKVTLPDGGKLD